MMGGAAEAFFFPLLILHFAFLGFKGFFLFQPARLASLYVIKFFAHTLNIPDFSTFQRGSTLT